MCHANRRGVIFGKGRCLQAASVAAGTVTLRVYKSTAPGQTIQNVSGTYRYDANGQPIGLDTSDGKTYIQFTAVTPTPGGGITIDDWVNIDKAAVGTLLSQQQRLNDPTATPYTDPFALDRDGDGIRLGFPVRFDMNADGQAGPVAWPMPSDPLLVMDRDHDGRIDNGHELVATLDFLNLDSNRDRRLDELDRDWALLQVWQDRNLDGYAYASLISKYLPLNDSLFNLAA